jgi:hypothetical protein
MPQLADAVDGLTEKRATTRLNTLQKVYDLMCEHFAKYPLRDRVETITHGVLQCITRGTSDKEVILGIETLTVINITLYRTHHTGRQQQLAPIELDEETVHRIRDVLTLKAVEGKTNETNQNIRHAALFALAVFGFVEDDPRELLTKNLITYEQEYWKESDNSVLAQAITSWSLMASAVPTHLVVNVLFPRVKSQLIKMLGKGDLGVKMACGEALAFLYESRYMLEDDDEEQEESSFDQVDNDLLETLQQLSTTTTKQVAKKDRSVQKSSFRDVLNTIQDGDSPEIKFVVKKTTLTFHTWGAIIQYNAFKTILGSGLIHHISENPFIQRVFDVHEHVFDEKNARKLNKGEKQAMFSKKAAHQKLNTMEKAIRTRSARDLTLLDNDDE